jgi:HD-GYP domain-containing protein (c-di-GMP phosphodiesterase class II)
MVAGIVLLTTIILYPSINTLLRRVSGLSADLLHANMEILSVLGSAVAKRDNDTDIHSYRVTIYAVRLAEELGLPENEIRALIKGAFLHDVGKIGIRDSILLKPSNLTSEEFKEMTEHVRHGMDIVSGSVWLRDAAQVVGSHHEKYDGTGYLEKRNNGDIPKVARIFTIADVFDALSSKRPYKDAMSYEETLNILIGGKGSHFDPEIMDVFLKIAPVLYETYANRDDDKPREDLKQINSRYFGPDAVGDISLSVKRVSIQP